MKTKYIINRVALMLVMVTLITACEDEKYEIPEAKNELQNDCIKRSMGPNVIGNPIEFAYAMALPQSLGSLVSAQVEASIPGASSTYLENKAYSTAGGLEVSRQIGDPSSTEGSFTNVNFTRDTFAVTLRYFYVIPPEARGQSVNFKFTANDSNGKSVSYEMGPYTISNMDMVLDRTVSDNNAMYISIEDMAVYNAADAAANPDKIDLVYLYRTPAGKTFAHALVAPAADPIYLPGVTLPAGVDNNTKIIKNLNLRDRHLANGQWGVYIDDVDFEKLDMSTASNFAINVKNEGGVWVETENGQYRAFVYIKTITNTATNKSMVVCMKRLQMF
jgi:hypothetical protein